MSNRIAALDFGDLIGDKRNLDPNLRPRFCSICQKTLSMYNKGKYCYIHVQKGFQIEEAKEDKKQAKMIKNSARRCNTRYYLKLKEKSLKKCMKT